MTMTAVTITKKKNSQPITALTAYDYVTAGLLDQAGVDILLVGDSLGNVVMGENSTLGVTMADMIHHCRAVSRAATNAMVVADMPFLSYQTSNTDALRNAGKLLTRGGAQAVKLEGGGSTVDRVRALIGSGIPVMGHIGVVPQSIHLLGSYKKRGSSSDEALHLEREALALQEAGVFALVLEGVVPELAQKLTTSLTVPTIGIASGPQCDGQILVINDLLGYSLDAPPPFVQPRIQLASMVRETVQGWCDEVRNSTSNSRG